MKRKVKLHRMGNVTILVDADPQQGTREYHLTMQSIRGMSVEDALDTISLIEDSPAFTGEDN